MIAAKGKAQDDEYQSGIHTKILLSTGPIHNPSNLRTIGYCVEHPAEVLRYAIDKGYRIGGYRQAEQTNSCGCGLVIQGTDMAPLDFGLYIAANMQQVPFADYSLKMGGIGEEDLRWMFYHVGGPIRPYRFTEIGKGSFMSLFLMPEEYIRPEDKKVMAAARELVEAVKGEPVSLEYLISLSRK